MAKDDIGREIQAKSTELKNFFKDLRAVLEEWKFSVEETKEGTRIEVHAVALVRHPKRSKSEHRYAGPPRRSGTGSGPGRLSSRGHVSLRPSAGH